MLLWKIWIVPPTLKFILKNQKQEFQKTPQHHKKKY